jgi:hypothetical protein
MNMGLNER